MLYFLYAVFRSDTLVPLGHVIVDCELLGKNCGCIQGTQSPKCCDFSVGHVDGIIMFKIQLCPLGTGCEWMEERSNFLLSIRNSGCNQRNLQSS